MSGDSGTENNRVFRILGISERKKATISGEIIARKTDDDALIVQVGNTGLRFRFGNLSQGSKYTISSDYMPGGAMEAGDISPIAAARVLGFGLRKFIEWVKNTDEIDKDKISELQSKTNPTFASFLDKIFKQNSKAELLSINDSDTGLWVNLNLKALIALDENDVLLKTIKKFSQKAGGMEFDAMEPFRWNQYITS